MRTNCSHPTDEDGEALAQSPATYQVPVSVGRVSSSEKCLFRPSARFLIGLLGLGVSGCRSPLDI